MHRGRLNPSVIPVAAVAVAGALVLSGCAKDLNKQLADAEVRQKVIETLLASPPTRSEVIEQLTKTQETRAAVIERFTHDEKGAGELVQKILSDDRGKALVVSKITSDDATAKTVIRMLMLTGVMGSSLTQKQADLLGMGDAYTIGTRRRTVTDLKRFGRAIDVYAKEKGGKAPDCQNLADVRNCLAKKMPAATLLGVRLEDAWGRPFQYRSYKDGSGYVLLSYANDGIYDGLGMSGPTESLDCDIVFANGGFVQWPGSLRKEDLQ